MQFRALPGIPLIQPGDDLAGIIMDAAHADGMDLRDDDVLVVTQKIVSKAEGRIVRLSNVVASPAARELADRTGRPAAHCQLYLDESRAITAVEGRHVVTVHRIGYVGTAAGVDMSNVAERAEGFAVLLPADPDASARRIREGLRLLSGRHPLSSLQTRLAAPIARAPTGPRSASPASVTSRSPPARPTCSVTHPNRR
jgi:coenzyme F420-0:L-glutamate ligase / coenzyme F420-1:gamma-L-glutamate ligase